MKKICVFAGTRPEIIKMAPVVKALKSCAHFDVYFCSTGQHKEMLYQALADFELSLDVDLGVMAHNQSLAGLSSILYRAIDDFLANLQPDIVLVQGDTTTVHIASLCAFYRGIKIGHVEAGLRSYDMLAPFPEELNRRITSLVADWHFVPTQLSCDNLIKEGIPSNKIHITGNTVVDALLWMVEKVRRDPPKLPDCVEDIIRENRHMVLVTGHRRENIGEPFYNICRALRELATKYSEVAFVYPVHLNPKVKDVVYEELKGITNVYLIEPQAYKPFVRLLDNSSLILSDSGGIQEEGPSLGKTVFIMRDVTERPEGVKAGVNVLVGTKSEDIVYEVGKKLDELQTNFQNCNAITLTNPYGDGVAADKILAVFRKY